MTSCSTDFSALLYDLCTVPPSIDDLKPQIFMSIWSTEIYSILNYLAPGHESNGMLWFRLPGTKSANNVPRGQKLEIVADCGK